jgi:hypothetical protein
MPLSDKNRAYRVRNIPGRYDKKQITTVLEELLESKDQHCELVVRTLTLDTSQLPRKQTATFSLVSAHLPEQLATLDCHEWRFSISDECGQVSNEELIIDDHFRGFTVLWEPSLARHEFE